MRTVLTITATWRCVLTTAEKGHLSNEDSAYCPSYVHIEMCSIQTISEMRTSPMRTPGYVLN